MFGRGTARGLLNYQEKIDKQRAKLQEKIDARAEKLQALLVTRSASSAKAKTFTGDSIILKNRLGNTEGANLIYQAIANDPSSAPRLTKKIKEAESRLNYELSPQQIIEFFPILQTGSPKQVEGYMSTGDIVEAMKGDLSDNELYFSLLRGASTPRATSGSTAFGDKFIAKSQPETVNKQTQEYQASLLRMAQNDYDNNPNITGQAKQDLLSDIRKTKDKNFGGLESRYGLTAVKQILDNPTPITRDIIMVNPTIRRTLDSIRDDVKKDLIKNQNDAQAVADFDEYFGRGAARYIISRGI